MYTCMYVCIWTPCTCKAWTPSAEYCSSTSARSISHHGTACNSETWLNEIYYVEGSLLVRLGEEDHLWHPPPRLEGLAIFKEKKISLTIKFDQISLSLSRNCLGPFPGKFVWIRLP